MTSTQQLTLPIEGISCHAWNADRTHIAVCPNNNEIHIYSTVTQPWTRQCVLSEHDLLVSAIDWDPVYNRIVSCAHDRNAFVWTIEGDTWKPALVILRIDRAAIDVKWSADGKKFAVTSGAKCVSVCTYDPSNDWWVSKMIKKKIKSTVLSCAFHPKNGQLLATGCADFKCRIFSTFSADVDGNNVNPGPFASPLEFGEPYCELSALGWINDVAWSPSGEILAFAGHDSSVHFATFTPSGPVVQTIRFSFLPLRKLVFLNDKCLVGAGFDFNPAIFALSGNGWAFHSFIDQKKEVKQAASGGVAAARAMFQSKASRGQDAKSESDILWTKHENVISGLSLGVKRGSSVTQIYTSSLDGRIVTWDLPSLEIDIASLSI